MLAMQTGQAFLFIPQDKLYKSFKGETSGTPRNRPMGVINSHFAYVFIHYTSNTSISANNCSAGLVKSQFGAIQ